MFIVLTCCAVEDVGTPPEVNTCPAGVAQIEVGDGYLRRLCGCTEPAGSLVTGASPLICTVSAGQTVFFQYLVTRLQHQIYSEGTPSFISSPVSDPRRDERTIRVHGVRFDTPGTYEFRDLFSPELSGSIVVQ